MSLNLVRRRFAHSPPRALPTATASLLVAAALCAPTEGQTASVHLANIVPVATAVNDFELAPSHVDTTWSQQGIRVTQMNPDPGSSIWLASGLGHGARSWYPDAGDDGWTRITLDSGANFDALSFFGGSGWASPPQTLYFELADDGVVVLAGTLPATWAGSWFGFAGGDFDEVRMRASLDFPGTVADCPFAGAGLCNILWVDDIRVGVSAVPEPSTAWLALPALLAATSMRLRRRPGQPRTR